MKGPVGGSGPGPVTARGGKVSSKWRQFVAAFEGEAKLDGVEACRIAGYSNPSRAWWQLRQRRRVDLEEIEKRFRERLTMDWPEVEAGIAAVARNLSHKDRLKALELLAKIHGKLDPKLSIQFDRTTLEKHITEIIAQLGEQVAAEQPKQVAAGTAIPKPRLLPPKP